MMRIYIVTFDPHKVNTQAFHTAVTTIRDTHSWWHYLASAYLIASSASLAEVQNHIRLRLPYASFLVLRVDTTTAGGYLAKDAWDWIKRWQGLVQ